MIASSVTGLSGPGDSNGKYKPQNNCSCSCCCDNSKKEINLNKNKKGCFSKYKICKQTKYKLSSGSTNIKIC